MRPRLLALRRLVLWLPLLPTLLMAASQAGAVTIDWVPVGNPGNAADTAVMTCCGNSTNTSGYGDVAYTYFISKYEVTYAQYAEFLNAKATSDPLGLYNAAMNSTSHGGITQAGVSGSFSYTVKPGYANKPVVYVSVYDALRFANWLNNGQGSGDTETGAYTLVGGTATPSNGTIVTRNALATTFLPSDDEWYKAAYFNGTGYFAYPAGTSTATTCSAPTATANRANCQFQAAFAATNVGAYTGSPSPHGTFDQGGNAGEWDEAIISGSNRVFRGGSWGVPPTNAGLAATYRNETNPTAEVDYIGFRVASLVPEPGTALLLGAGLAPLGARRRRR